MSNIKGSNAQENECYKESFHPIHVGENINCVISCLCTWVIIVLREYNSSKIKLNDIGVKVKEIIHALNSAWLCSNLLASFINKENNASTVHQGFRNKYFLFHLTFKEEHYNCVDIMFIVKGNRFSKDIDVWAHWSTYIHVWGFISCPFSDVKVNIPSQCNMKWFTNLPLSALACYWGV